MYLRHSTDFQLFIFLFKKYSKNKIKNCFVHEVLVEIDCELYALEYRKTEYTYNNEEQRHLRNYLEPNSH